MSTLIFVGWLILSALVGWLARGSVRGEFGLVLATIAGVIGIVVGAWLTSLIYTMIHGPLIVSGIALGGLAFLVFMVRLALCAGNDTTGEGLGISSTD